MDFNDIKNLASSEKLADLKEKAEEVARTVAEKAEKIGDSVNIDSVK